MAPTLLFITGALAGLIAGFILSRVFVRSRSSDGSGEARLLQAGCTPRPSLVQWFGAVAAPGAGSS